MKLLVGQFSTGKILDSKMAHFFRGLNQVPAISLGQVDFLLGKYFLCFLKNFKLVLKPCFQT